MTETDGLKTALVVWLRNALVVCLPLPLYKRRSIYPSAQQNNHYQAGTVSFVLSQGKTLFSKTFPSSIHRISWNSSKNICIPTIYYICATAGSIFHISRLTVSPCFEEEEKNKHEKYTLTQHRERGCGGPLPHNVPSSWWKLSFHLCPFNSTINEQ